MSFHRVFADASGVSRIEAIDVDHPLLVGDLRPTRFYLKRFPPGTRLEPHPAPRRMLTVVVRGELELGLADGSVHRFLPGDVRLLEDTLGSGHSTRVVGDEEVVLAVAVLDRA